MLEDLRRLSRKVRLKKFENVCTLDKKNHFPLFVLQLTTYFCIYPSQCLKNSGIENRNHAFRMNRQTDRKTDNKMVGVYHSDFTLWQAGDRNSTMKNKTLKYFNL